MYCIPPLHRKLYPAVSPRRRRMAPSSRSRTIYVGNGSLTLGSNRTCTNSTHPHSPHKSFAELFQKRPFPRSPVPSSPRPPRSPKNIVNPKAKPPTDVRDKNERKNPQRVKRSLDSGCGDADLPPLAVRRIPRRCSERKLGAQTIREGTVLAVAGFLIRLF